LRLHGERRESEADGENEPEPDQPHPAGESSRRPLCALAPRLSPADKQRVIESLLFAVEMFQRLALDVEAVMTKALTLVGSEASTLAQTIAAVTKEVADHDKRTADERRERENASWLNK
jgi:hypothetical protein